MREYNADKMFTFLRGFCSGGEYPGTKIALGFMRDKHAGQVRKSSGQPYIVHPLSMACYAIGIAGCKEDDLLAAILLHDVSEDSKVPIQALPCSEKAKKAVKYLTITKLPGEEDYDTKSRYFSELLECRRSAIIKGLDRFDNLSTMEEVLVMTPQDSTKELYKARRSLFKNVYETHFLLLPVLKEAKEKWPNSSEAFNLLRYNIRAINSTLAYANGIDLYNEINTVSSIADGVSKYKIYAQNNFGLPLQKI